MHYRAQKVQLKPNATQEKWMRLQGRACRYAYNQAIALWKQAKREQREAYKAGEEQKKLPSGNDLRKIVVPQMQELKDDDGKLVFEGIAWNSVHKVFRTRVQKSIDSFFRACKGGGKKKKAALEGEFDAFEPKFCRYAGDDTFEADGRDVSFDGSFLKFPIARNLTWQCAPGQTPCKGIRMNKSLRYPDAKIQRLTVIEEAGRWYAAIVFAFETPPHEDVPPAQVVAPVGLDLGVITLATIATQDGEHVAKVHPDQAYAARVDKLSRTIIRLQRMKERKVKPNKKTGQKASRSWWRVVKQLRRANARLANIRRDWIKNTCSKLADNYEAIVIAGDNVKRQTETGKRKSQRWKAFRKKMLSLSPGAFRLELVWQMTRRGRKAIVADQFCPSTKTCSKCGWVHPSLKLDERAWRCGGCDEVHDRDVNAARNLAAQYRDESTQG